MAMAALGVDMVRTSTKTFEVEFTEEEQRHMRNGATVQFEVGDKTIYASFEEGEEPHVRDTDIPENGHVVRYDQKPQQWSDGKVVVTEVTDTPAHECKAVRQDPKNAEYPDNDPVVKARYIRENGERSREYSFPASRLSPTPSENPETLGELFE